MMLFAVELPDATCYLISAANVDAAIEEAERRSGIRPVYIWKLWSAERRVVPLKIRQDSPA